MGYRGVELPISNSADYSEDFDEFFEKKIADASYVQSVEKVKK